MLLIAFLAESMRFFVLIPIRYRAWQPLGPKYPEYDPRKSVVWLPGQTRTLLPNSTDWTFLVMVLGQPF